MRRFYCAALIGVAVVGFASIASAADLPVKAATYIPPPSPTYNWTGWYVGVNAGGNRGTSNTSTTTDSALFIGNGQTAACIAAGFPAAMCNAIGGSFNNAAMNNRSFTTSGFTGGIQGGYNWQSGHLLAGIEVDFESFRSAGSDSLSGPTLPFGGGTVWTLNSSMSTDWLFTARSRYGIVANNWLFYGTGGLAVTRLNAHWSYVDLVGAYTASASVTKTGWTAGGGIETALPGNWLIGAEYLFVKFGDVSVVGTNASLPGTFTQSTDLSANIIRARLSKKFGSAE